jgi:hypoxanthine phosphoribosyltransferase
MAIIKVHDRFFESFILSSEIALRVKSIANQLNEAYEGKNPLFVAVLNGAFIFAADLLREVTIENEITFVKIASYQGTQSSENIIELIGFSDNITNRHLIIIEDIIDTGLSMKHIVTQVQALNPASINIVTLLLKPTALKHPIQIAYIGFEIENKFVLGYGLDYDGQGRNLPHIFVEKSDTH